MYRLRFRPGLHNLALMELFGFIDVECTVADENETWPLSVIKPTDWGRAIFGYFVQNNLFIPLFDDDEPDQAGSGIWETEFKKYIPDWKRSLLQVERNITEEGAYIFNVSLGKAS